MVRRDWNACFMGLVWQPKGSRSPGFYSHSAGFCSLVEFPGHLCNPDKNGASILEAESAVWEGLASVPSTAATSVYGHRFLCRVAELVSWLTSERRRRQGRLQLFHTLERCFLLRGLRSFEGYFRESKWDIIWDSGASIFAFHECQGIVLLTRNIMSHKQSYASPPSLLPSAALPDLLYSVLPRCISRWLNSHWFVSVFDSSHEPHMWRANTGSRA